MTFTSSWWGLNAALVDLSAGNEAHSGVLRTHLGGSQATLGPLEDAAEGWQMETTTGLWEVQSVGSSTPGRSRPAFQESCCRGFKVLSHPGDGEIGDGNVPDQAGAGADPMTVEV